MAEIVGEEQELNTQTQSTTPSGTNNDNNVQTISRRSLFATASGPEPEGFRTRITETMKTISIDTKELCDLRQLSTSFYKNFCPIYLKQLHTTLYISTSTMQPSEVADYVTKIPKEVSHMYREIEINDWAFLTGGAEEDRVMRSLQNIMPHIRKLDICAKAYRERDLHDEDINYGKSIPFLKYFSFNEMFPRLEILEIHHFEADLYFQSFGNLFNTIPERVRINLNFDNLMLEMIPEIISKINSTERANIFVTADFTEYDSSSELEKLIKNFDPIHEWIQSGKLEVNWLWLNLCDITSDPNFDFRAIDGLIGLMKFTKLTLYGSDWDDPYPDVLSMPGEWKQQIHTLWLNDYSHPLLALQQFPNLKDLRIKIIRDPNGAQLWFPNPCPVPAREQLRDVFGGLTLVKVEMKISHTEWKKFRRILNKEQLIECIKPLVGEFKLLLDEDDSD